MECVYAIEHREEDPEQFLTVTEAEKKNVSIVNWKRDMHFYQSAIEEGEDPKKYLKLTDWDRLIGEELLRRSILKIGL
ncbi:9556_t:CDS:1, partial [Entrophospora sp. SA101]